MKHPEPIDYRVATTARMHNHLHGGIDSYVVDREACQRLTVLAPAVAAAARRARRFLTDQVKRLAVDGMTQFVDLGRGLPPPDSRLYLHRITQLAAPGSRLAYVDTDGMVLAHARAKLDENDNVAVVDLDIRDTPSLPDIPAAARILDPAAPATVILGSVLDCVPDTSPTDLIRAATSWCAPGSRIILTGVVSDDPAQRAAITDLMRDATGGRWGRMHAAVDLDEPLAALTTETGLRLVPDLHDDSHTAAPRGLRAYGATAAVGR